MESVAANSKLSWQSNVLPSMVNPLKVLLLPGGPVSFTLSPSLYVPWPFVVMPLLGWTVMAVAEGSGRTAGYEGHCVDVCVVGIPVAGDAGDVVSVKMTLSYHQDGPYLR